MPKRKRREHGRSGFSSSRYANVPTQYQRARRCGGRKLNNLTRSGQHGCRQMSFSRSATRGSPPHYGCIGVSGFSEGLATRANSHSPERKCPQFGFQMAHDGFPSEDRSNIPNDHHSSPHHGRRDLVDCSERQHGRATKTLPETQQYDNCIKTDPQFSSKAALQGFSCCEGILSMTDNYSSSECGNRDEFGSSETSLSYRASNGTLKREQYANSTENEHCFGFQMYRHDFPFDERKNLATDHQCLLFCKQDGKNKIISLPVIRIENQKPQLMLKGTDETDKNYLYWISSILSCLVENGNRMELEQLQREVERKHAKQYSNIETEIEKFPNIFDISESISDIDADGNEEEGILRDKYVCGKTDARLCEKHCSIAGSCSSEDCNRLHICKFYILNTCSFQQCLFGHDITDPHNVRVLQMYMLHALSIEDLRYLMRNIKNRNETTMPSICRFYNSWKGCSHNECQFLHLCKWFVRGDCKFDLTCQRSHNYFDRQPSLVLKRYGIHEEKYMEDVKMYLRDSTIENKSNYVVDKGKENPVGSMRLNRFVKYDQGHLPERKGSLLGKRRKLSDDDHTKRNGSELEGRVPAGILDSMSDQIATDEICKEIEEEARDSVLPSPNWMKQCLPISICNGELEVKAPTQFFADTNKINTAGDQELGKRCTVDLKYECLDQTDPSKNLERLCFSNRLSTTTTKNLTSFNNTYSGKEFVQAMSTTVSKNGYTVIPVDDQLLSRSEQRLSATIAQKHATSNVPGDTRNVRLKRVIGQDIVPTWICQFMDTMMSLTLEPDTSDHLEKSYQHFQQSRKCSIEICGLKLDVDLLTVEEV
ncbi:hypothetical protein CHS0354_002181 [Potamilus streckersoni]|uniref:C3H1-type domain-containing protein n=1 Tax=Potamilus streckersoni TaxID=2493646 RepID=A0AAE0VI07_9BIVA|nr:hypothetical protein CHS0354_002181 [Potamilus streckersoni]